MYTYIYISSPTRQFVPKQSLAVEPELAHAPTVDLVANTLGHVRNVSPAMSLLAAPRRVVLGRDWTVAAAASASDALESRPMSRPAIALPPTPRNEPVKDYAPGSAERAELQKRLHELERERIEIPLVIGGKDAQAAETFEAVKPHRKSHVLAEVHSGGPAEVERAIKA